MDPSNLVACSIELVEWDKLEVNFGVGEKSLTQVRGGSPDSSSFGFELSLDLKV